MRQGDVKTCFDYVHNCREFPICVSKRISMLWTVSRSYWASAHNFNTFQTFEYFMQPRERGEKKGGETNKFHTDLDKWDNAATGVQSFLRSLRRTFFHSHLTNPTACLLHCDVFKSLSGKTDWFVFLSWSIRGLSDSSRFTRVTWISIDNR